jgi:hypothetical protein
MDCAVRGANQALSPLFTKLNLKTTPELLVLNAPPTFESELALLIDRKILRAPGAAPASFAIAFAITQAELDTASRVLVQTKSPDPVLWIAYPKQSSKRYRCEFHRDSGYSVLGDAGFERVRMVAIDEDWSALRFRRVEQIKKLTRSAKNAVSSEGKRRIGA